VSLLKPESKPIDLNGPRHVRVMIGRRDKTARVTLKTESYMSKRFMKRSTFAPLHPGPSLRTQIADDVRSRFSFAGDIVDIFVSHVGEGVHKRHHYFPLYELYLRRWRNQPLRFLEIGVSKGGSLEMWRQYFGPQAQIYGLDINPACSRFNGQFGQVRIGSQDDPVFLNAIVDEMGGVDVVLDDGSHIMSHIRTSFLTLFPRLSEGGSYIIEDLHTSYWNEFGGGVNESANFYNFIRELIDDMHKWYHESGVKHSATAGLVTGIHVHDSLAAIDKGQAQRPVHSLVKSSTV
jgi:hypothetical protein